MPSIHLIPDMLAFLKSVGATFPPNCTMTDAELHARVVKAISFAQAFRLIIPQTFPNSINLVGHPLQSGRNLAIEMLRGVDYGTPIPRSRDTPFAALKSIIAKMADGLHGLGNHGRNWIFSSDINWESKPADQMFKSTNAVPRGENDALFTTNRVVLTFLVRLIQIVEVYALKHNQPMILVRYKDGRRGRPLQGKEHLSPVFSTITASNSLQLLLVELLQQNAQYLRRPGSQVPPSAEKPGFKTSFFIPIGDLTREEQAELSQNNGCPSCGKPAQRVCEDCKSVMYCNQDCEEIMHRAHKSVCKGLRGASWTTIRISPVDRFNIAVPPQVYGIQPFVVNMVMVNGAVAVTDAARNSFKALWYPPATAQTAGVVGTQGRHFWARRVVSWDLMVAFDKVPSIQFAA